LIGLPAAGKSTFYRDRLASTHAHVSKDLLRNNAKPQRRMEELSSDFLRQGRSVVVDNTNVSAAVRAPIIALAKQYGAEVVGYYFPTEAADALRRNRARTGRDRVPAVAVFATRKRLEPPLMSEGFDRLYTVRLIEAEREFEVTS